MGRIRQLRLRSLEKDQEWLARREQARHEAIQAAIANGPFELPAAWARPREKRYVTPTNADLPTRYLRMPNLQLPPDPLADGLRAAAPPETHVRQPWEDRPIDLDPLLTGHLLGLRSDAWHAHGSLLPLPEVPDSLDATQLPIAQLRVYRAADQAKVGEVAVHHVEVDAPPSRSMRAAARAAVRLLAERPDHLVAITRSDAGFSLGLVALPPQLDELADMLSDRVDGARRNVATAAGGQLELHWRSNSDALVAIAGVDGILHLAP